MPAEPDLLPPRYRDVEWFASGGMGDLYRAVDDELDRRVAVKVLARRFAADDRVRSRFRREALAAARLSDDPNTVTTFDVGEWRGAPFIVMELLNGGTLEEVLRSGAQPIDRVLPWLDEAAASLDAAHRRGVIHRDVKPANLFLDDGGHVRVGDFGIATAAGLDSLTLTGTVLGTAGYLAPEQALARPASDASDGYALAVVAYELLTGTRPFARESYAAEANAHVHDPVPRASAHNRRLPPAVDAVFTKALTKDPAGRFPTSAAFVAALRQSVAAGDAATRVRADAAVAERPSRRRAGAWHPGARHLVLLAAVVIAAIGGALLARGHSDKATTPPARPTATNTVPGISSSPQPPPPSTASASDDNTRGYELMQAGEYGAALPLLERAVAGLHDPADPVTAYANFNLGQTLVRLGRCSAALPYLQRAEQLEPERPEPREAIAYAQACAAGPPSPVASKHHPPPAHGHGHDHAPHDHGDADAQG
ncbi:MAG TPA: serine/threonine-protein kinase [Gaiellaceae bacterium]